MSERKSYIKISLYEPLLLRRPRFQSEKPAIILDSIVLSNVFHRVSDFLVSLYKRVVLLARPPRFDRVAMEFDPEWASSIVPDSDRSDPVFETGNSEKDVPAEVLPRTDAEVPKLPALIRVPFANCLTNSAVTLVSHLRRYCSRRAETFESVIKAKINLKK